MPPVTRFRIAAIHDLHRQLLYAPAEARRRQMEAAERLLHEITPAQMYPQDFVTYRITGYRPDRPGPSTVLVGEALVGDLATFVQRLSYGLALHAAAIDRRPLTLDQAADRLAVSSKTIQRYRQLGLVCHYLVFPDGALRLACFEDALTRFVERRPDRIARAASFSRLSDETAGQIVAEAAELHATRKMSLCTAARVLAQRHGRAHETIRALLLRHDAAVFGEHGALSARDRALIWRAARLGIGVSALAERLGKSPPSIHRGHNQERRRRLAAIGLDPPPGPVSALEAVEQGLPALATSVDALALVARLRDASPPAAADERRLTEAYNALRHRAAAAIAVLPATPSSSALDAIETDLRWATLVKRRLLDLGLPPALRALEQYLGRALTLQSAQGLVAGVTRLLEVASACADDIDPARGQRYSHVCGYAMTRALAAASPPAAGRAAGRHDVGSIVIRRPFEQLTAWQGWLGLRPDLRDRIAGLPPRHRAAIEGRYGLTGQRPRRLDEIAAVLGVTRSAAARLVAGGMRVVGRSP